MKSFFFFFLSQASDGRSSRWNFPQLPRRLHSYLVWNAVLLIKQNKTKQIQNKKQNPIMAVSRCRHEESRGPRHIFKWIKNSYKKGNQYKTDSLLTRSQRFICRLIKTETAKTSLGPAPKHSTVQSCVSSKLRRGRKTHKPERKQKLQFTEWRPHLWRPAARSARGIFLFLLRAINVCSLYGGFRVRRSSDISSCCVTLEKLRPFFCFCFLAVTRV